MYSREPLNPPANGGRFECRDWTDELLEIVNGCTSGDDECPTRVRSIALYIHSGVGMQNSTYAIVNVF